jgi:hypothetical protein
MKVGFDIFLDGLDSNVDMMVLIIRKVLERIDTQLGKDINVPVRLFRQEVEARESMCVERRIQLFHSHVKAV